MNTAASEAQSATVDTNSNVYTNTNTNTNINNHTNTNINNINQNINTAPNQNNMNNMWSNMGNMNNNGNGNGLLNPQMMTQALNSPLIQNMFDNPNLMRMVMDSNPQIAQLREQHPELNHVLNDPELMREAMQMIRNPNMMREMMRNTDRAMSNIEAMPGGFNTLRRMYQNIYEPMWEATADGGMGQTPTPTQTYDLRTEEEPTSEAFPDPWSNPSPSTGAMPSIPSLFTPQPTNQSTPGQNNTQMQADQASNMFNALQQLRMQQPGAAASQPTPSVVQPPEVLYRVQLDSLRAMGFDDTNACIEALRNCDGNLNRAIDRLLSNNQS